MPKLPRLLKSLAPDVMVHSVLPFLTVGDVLSLNGVIGHKRRIVQLVDRALHARVKKKFPTIIRHGPKGKRTRDLVRWIAIELDHFKLKPLITAREVRLRYMMEYKMLGSTEAITRVKIHNRRGFDIPYQVRMLPRACRYSRELAIQRCFEKFKSLNALRRAKYKRHEKQHKRNEISAKKRLDLFGIDLF